MTACISQPWDGATPMESSSVRAGLALENDRPPMRYDEPIPGEQRADLARGDFAVIIADQPPAPRNGQEASGRAVLDIGRRRGGDLAGRVGTDTVICSAGC